MIAALYVAAAGVYSTRADVDVWPETRDARGYAGPWPVVAHPPCRNWSILGQCRPEIIRGDDGGCFAAALNAVRRYGGVLEHPAHTHAWRTFGLARPPAYGWARGLFDEGWTCQVDQALYGHPTRKLTWLYYVSDDPPPMLWGDGGRQRRTTANNHRRNDDTRSATPPAFADLLLSLARASRVTLDNSATVAR